MKKLPTSLLLACGACAVGAVSVKAYSYTQVTDYEPNATVYGYYNYYDFKGYDSLGAVTNETTRLGRLQGETVSIPKPSGAMNGGTIGFSEKVSGGDLLGIEAGALSGKPDSNYTLSYTEEGVAYTTRGKLQYDMKNVFCRLYWTPAKVKYLTFAIDYTHVDNTQNNFVTGYADGVYLGKGVNSFGTTSDDVLLTMTAQTPNLYLFKQGWNALYLNARAEAGIGYTYRTSDKYWLAKATDADGKTYSEYVNFAESDAILGDAGIKSDEADKLPQDSGIYNYSASAELAFRTQWGTVSSISGYQFRGDMDESSNSNHGFFTMIGYRYSW